MAVWDDEGYIHIVDRKKEIIISGGENISSIEVEKAISAHPEVFECAVVAAPDEKWGEVPAAIVVRKAGSQLQEPALCEFLERPSGKVQDAARDRVLRRAAAKDRNRENSEADTERKILGWQNQARPRIAICFPYGSKWNERNAICVIAELWDAGAAGITEEPHALRAFFGPEGSKSVNPNSPISSHPCKKRKTGLGSFRASSMASFPGRGAILSCA